MSNYTEDQQEIIDYLKGQIETGKVYFKAKDMGKDLGMSAYSIGGNLYKLSQKCKTLKIIQWSCSNSVTWRIEKATRKKVKSICT
jgi:hypothetical protein